MMREYRTIRQIAQSLIVAESVEGVVRGDLCELVLGNGTVRAGRVLDVTSSTAIIMLYDIAAGISVSDSMLRFPGHPPRIALSDDLLGRVFNPIGEPVDGGPALLSGTYGNIYTAPVSPASREYPRDALRTGIAEIDERCPIALGQKIAVFSGIGMPHMKLAAQIACQARVSRSQKTDKLTIVFASIGLTFEESEGFAHEVSRAGAFDRSVMFTSSAGDTAAMRTAAAHTAMTAAEYLAFERDLHVLLVLADMTSYAGALSESSSARREFPGRRGYPDCMFDDFASLYERAGLRKGKDGSITLMPILTLPEDDITHPIADITGSITEGRIVLSRSLHRKGFYPPVDALRSQSSYGDKYGVTAKIQKELR